MESARAPGGEMDDSRAEPEATRGGAGFSPDTGAAPGSHERAPEIAETTCDGPTAAGGVTDEPQPGAGTPPIDMEAVTVVAMPEVTGSPAPAESDADVVGRGESIVGDTLGGDLEELLLPPSIRSPDPLPPDTEVGPEGTVRIDRFIGTRGRLNRYSATVRGADGQRNPCELREALADLPDLRREGEVLAEIRYAMLPRSLVAFEQDGRRYVALEWHDERETLADALATRLDTARALSIVLQLTQVLRRLHAGGWALLGLQPAHIALGEPLQITQLGTVARIGQEAEGALNVAGYSAPEVAHRALVTGKEDVYTLGALLYRVLVGTPVPEQGPELASLGALMRLPGAPQLLDAALAPVEERADLEGFYRQLLAFKDRWARRSLALELASGTTIGLNRTRTVNEDAHACVSWSLAHQERVAQRALLCVVDGMGGMEAGEVASRAAVLAVLAGAGGDAWLAPEPPEPVRLVQAAARAVYDAAAGRAVGATITCAVLDDGTLTLAHVGDTRAYLLRGGILSQLTNDHSLVAAMVAGGVLTVAEARGHPDSNKVLRSLGGQRDLAEAYIDTLATTRGAAMLRLLEGDRLLLCSDGVWGVLDDDALRALLADGASCAAIAQAALGRVLDGGAPDNATLIVARCVALPSN